VPVKIVLDGNVPSDILRPGLSAEVAIHTDRVETAEEQH